jgi:iron complex outermembrane receptor protein
VSDGFRYDIARPRQEMLHELVRAKAWFHTENAGKWLLTYGRQYNLRKEFDKHIPLNDSLAGLNLPSLQFEITTHSLELLHEHRLGNSITGSVGVNALFQFNTYEGRFFIPNFRKWNAGLFLIEKWRSADGRNELEGGIRYDYTSQQIFMWDGQNLMQPLFLYRGLSGNISYRRNLTDALSITWQSGYSWRPPHVSEMFSNGIHHGTASYERGDANLNPESVFGNSINTEWKGKKFRFSGEAYYNFFDNMIFLNPELPPVLTIRGAFPSFAYRQTKARHYGATAGFFYDVFPFLSVEMNGSLLRAFTDQGYFLPLMPSDRSEVALHLSHEKNSLHEKTFSLRLSRVNKQWRAEPLSDFIPPPGAYMLVGLESGICFHIGVQPVRIGVEVRNLFNASYREYLDRLRYYTNSTGTNLLFRLSLPLNISNHQFNKK